MPALSELLPPRYQEPRLIGRGGMGAIYLARDESLDREVAIKVLEERYAQDDDLRGRFTREALAAARLGKAPSTVTIFDVGEWNGRPFIVMEYLPGGSLADRLDEEGAQPPGRALDWLEQAARALDAAHAAGVVHRDVKPANLLLDDRGCVRVADFGIASAAGLDSNTAAGTILGTAGYLAPEQARGEPVTGAADRYALAAVAFELLTGSRPFQRDSAAAEAAAHLNDPVPSASALDPELPRELDAVFERGLAKDPSARYASSFELAHALREAIGRAAGETRRLPVAAPPVHHRPRRGLLPLALGLLALLAAGGVGAALLAAGEDPQAETPQTLTVTQEGTTATIVTTAPPPEATAPPTTETPPATTGESAVALSDQGRDLIREGRYEEAIPPIERSLELSSGTGWLVEAYASYNLAFARLQLGRCDDVGALLDRSEEIQGRRKEVDRLRKEARKTCG
ncbi:MAG: serine/threonine-protein kinase [Gaiellaceae bacterium]